MAACLSMINICQTVNGGAQPDEARRSEMNTGGCWVTNETGRDKYSWMLAGETDGWRQIQAYDGQRSAQIKTRKLTGGLERLS